jgi:hypothetical protein
MAWFFVGYDTRITLPDSGAAEANWWSYPRFMAISVSRLLWMRGDRAEPVGFLVLAFSAWALVYHVRILILGIRESARSRAVVLFVGFGLLFAAGIAAGRLPIGLRAGTASRYMTLLSLLYFGLYLGAFSIRGRIQQGMLAAAIALLIYGAIPLRNSTMERMAYFRDNKVQWRDTYLMTESIEAASRAVSLPVHPDPNSSRLAEQLAYLKDRKLSFFRQVDRHEPMPQITQTNEQDHLCNDSTQLNPQALRRKARPHLAGFITHDRQRSPRQAVRCPDRRCRGGRGLVGHPLSSRSRRLRWRPFAVCIRLA